MRKSGWWRMFEPVWNNLSRVARLGNYWYWTEPSDLSGGIDVASLVCPLRYDVVVRRDFYAFYAARRELFIADFAAFLDLARQSTYHTWFVDSEIIRCLPHLRGDAEAIEAEFARRVRRAVTLYESVAERGFIHKTPIILKTAEQLLPPTTDRRGPPTGKLVSARYFLADGCHRLAILMMQGYTLLPAGFFHVKCFRKFSPFDSTSLLAPSLRLDPAAYFTFLSSYYCSSRVLTDEASFLAYIEAHAPDLLEEVRSIIRVDGFAIASCAENRRAPYSALDIACG
jgi:hypothetical protein